MNHYFGGLLPAPSMPKRVTPSSRGLVSVSLRFFSALCQRSGQTGYQSLSEIYLSTLPQIDSLCFPESLGLAVITFQVAIGDKDDYLINLLSSV